MLKKLIDTAFVSYLELKIEFFISKISWNCFLYNWDLPLIGTESLQNAIDIKYRQINFKSGPALTQ